MGGVTPEQGRNQGGSKGSADPSPEISGGARFGGGVRFGDGARFDMNHAFLVSFVGSRLLQKFSVGTDLLRQYTLLRTFLISIPFWKGLS